MLSRSEEKQLEQKKRQFDEAMRPIDSFWKKASNEVRMDMKNIFDFYFFFQPKDTTDKIWHFICIVLIDAVLLRLFGLI